MSATLNSRISCPESMEWARSGEDLFVRLDPGEEIHATLQSLADKVGFCLLYTSPSPRDRG